MKKDQSGNSQSALITHNALSLEKMLVKNRGYMLYYICICLDAYVLFGCQTMIIGYLLVGTLIRKEYSWKQ
jgi:hypothetical protein